MNLPRLTVIEASAGTGKTFSLVTRLLTLIFGGVEPERIVALTFSRLAAGEIFNSFIDRLASAASGEEAAARESGRIAEAAGLSAPLRAADFAAMLRKVVSRQHLTLIGTLDSFLMRIVRMIPLELGLQGEVKVMGEHRAPVEQARLLGRMMMLSGKDAKEGFREAFRLAFGSSGARSFLDGFSSFIDEWHVRSLDFGSPSAWGDPRTVWGDTPPAWLDCTIQDIRSLAGSLQGFSGRRGADRFISAVAGFSGSVPKALPAVMQGDPAAMKAMAMMRAWRIARAVCRTRGVYWLMRMYEGAYRAETRSRGLVTFDDMPRLVNGLPPAVRLALEYRMDARFDHWALDEFQDTSTEQWKAIDNLIDENAQSRDARTVFIVGDRKQSIYGWRGGDVRILGEQAELAARKGNSLVGLNESYRYLPAIAGAVNRVFGENVVRGAFDMDCAPDAAKWRCAEHESSAKSPAGFVEVVQAVKEGARAKASDFFAPVENALAAVRPWERGLTAAILVRKNGFGAAILDYLRSKGLGDVVFEGDSGVLDAPALSAMVELVRLAEHSGDRFAYAHILHSPLAEALFPGGAPPAHEVSAKLLGEFSRVGMVRFFREVRESLKKVPGSWNGFTEARFADFIKCAAEFEDMRDSTMRLSDFAEYVVRKTRRDFAEPGKVRIMTMHQSKGLGFDHVILPLFESESMYGERHTGPLEGDCPRWVMCNPGTHVDMSDPVLAKAERERRQRQLYGSLCLHYVAMTRAKKALTVILNPCGASVPAEPAYFSDLVRMVGLETTGDRAWYAGFPLRGPGQRAAAEAHSAPPVRRRMRCEVAKSRPSEMFFPGLTGDMLFSDDFGKAAKRGTQAHAMFEKVEWLDASEARTPLERALVKPSPDAILWRERSYELFEGGRWESGQFDRVVVTGSGESRRAVVYDFKTNAVHRGESVAAFEGRMCAAYAGQMSAYRRALASLLSMPPERISSVLLLQATGSAVSVA